VTKLSVNLNKLALLRNARGKNEPDPIAFGRKALELGASGLTVHPRPDQRHARYSDLPLLHELVSQFPGTELNIEGNPTPELMAQVLQVKPHQCTLVPDEPGQLTSDHGWDAAAHRDFLVSVIERLKGEGIRASVFVDPDPKMVLPIAEVGADRVELYTEDYALAVGTENESSVISNFRQTAEKALDLGMQVNAGHDLTLLNLRKLIEEIPEIAEVSIGHALTVEALQQGWETTIQNYLEILKPTA